MISSSSIPRKCVLMSLDSKSFGIFIWLSFCCFWSSFLTQQHLHTTLLFFRINIPKGLVLINQHATAAVLPVVSVYLLLPRFLSTLDRYRATDIVSCYVVSSALYGWLAGLRWCLFCFVFRGLVDFFLIFALTTWRRLRACIGIKYCSLISL